MTIALRAVRASDAAWIGSWFSPVAASVGFSHGDYRALIGEDSRGASVITLDRRPIGLLVYRLLAGDAAIIEFVGTPPVEARRGSGMQAAALLERALSKRGVRTILAPAPESHGIAMYFWIRLGYRPLLREEWPGECDGVAWLSRDIAPAPMARRRAANRGSR